MLKLVCISDVARRSGVTATSVKRWLETRDSFPQPVAVYGASDRPLFDPAEVESWVRANRPQYAQEVSA